MGVQTRSLVGKQQTLVRADCRWEIVGRLAINLDDVSLVLFPAPSMLFVNWTFLPSFDSSREHTAKYFLEILLNQTVIRLYLPFTDWFETVNGRCSFGVPNQSENGEYNLILVWFNDISKRFLSLYPKRLWAAAWMEEKRTEVCYCRLTHLCPVAHRCVQHLLSERLRLSA